MADEKKDLTMDDFLGDELPDIESSEFAPVNRTASEINTDMSDIGSDEDEIGEIEVPDLTQSSDTGEESSEEEDLFDLFADAQEDETLQESTQSTEQYEDMNFSDLELTSDYSEEFIDEETRNFLDALSITLQYRSNPAAVIQEPKSHNIISRSKSAVYSDFIQIMKGLLDSIQKYNEKLDVNLLPARLRPYVKTNRPMTYNDKEGIVWNEFYTRAGEAAGTNSAKLNRLRQNAVQIRAIFSSYCDNYENMDEYHRAERERRERNERIAAKDFAFYMEIQKRLESGSERVALCNSLTFSATDVVKYKFQCGRCKELADGATSIISSVTGADIPEGDTHAFYQLLTKGTRSLFYPLVCEHCGAINTLSTSTRRMMSENMLKEPTKSSRDITDYRSDNISDKGNQTIGNRRMIPKAKWMDLLEDKLVTEDMSMDLPDIDLTQDEILDREFYINEEEDFTISDELISEVDRSSYRNAIKLFRQKDDTINCKNDIERNGTDGIESALALIASNGNTTLLNGIFDLIASYMVGTNAIKMLHEANRDKKAMYDRYLAIHSALNLCQSNEDILESAKREFTEEYKVDFNLGDLTLADIDSLKDYNNVKKEYEKLRYEVYSNPVIFGYKRKDKITNAIYHLAEAFDFDAHFPEFMIEVLRETIINVSMINLQASFGMKVNGRKIIAESVKGLSPIKDREHIQGNKYKTIKEYCNRVVKNHDKLGIDIKKLIDAFHSDYSLYLKIQEWKGMFNFSDRTKIDDITASGEPLTYYYKTLANTCGDISKFEGCTVGDLVLKFETTEYFRIFFNSSEAFKLESKSLFDTLLSLPNFAIYDILFSRLLLSQVSFAEFIGMSGMDIASNLRLTNGIVMKFYNAGIESVRECVSIKERAKYDIEGLISHKFLHYRNSEECIRLLESYYLPEAMADSDELYNQIGYIKAEFGVGVEGFEPENLEQEIPFLFNN